MPDPAPPTTDIATVPIDDLIRHPDNPRQGDIGAISASIEVNGWYGTVVAQSSTRHVLAGNNRMEAARRLGMTDLPVHWLDVDDATARRIMLADNRTSDLATYDDAVLVQLLEAAAADDDLFGTGFDGDDLDDLLGAPTVDWAEAFGLVPPGGDGSGIMTITFTVHESDAALILAACDAYPVDDAVHELVTGSASKRGTALAHIVAENCVR